MTTLNAYDDLMKFLEKDEVVENIIFGDYGWSGFGEDVKFIKRNQKNKLMTIDEAKPLMNGWSFDGGFGSPDCYATYIWTNKRVIWVTQYDGSTNLDSMPRNPIACKPDMLGG